MSYFDLTKGTGILQLIHVNLRRSLYQSPPLFLTCGAIIELGMPLLDIAVETESLLNICLDELDRLFLFFIPVAPGPLPKAVSFSTKL